MPERRGCGLLACACLTLVVVFSRPMPAAGENGRRSTGKIAEPTRNPSARAPKLSDPSTLIHAQAQLQVPQVTPSPAGNPDGIYAVLGSPAQQAEPSQAAGIGPTSPVQLQAPPVADELASNDAFGSAARQTLPAVPIATASFAEAPEMLQSPSCLTLLP